MTDETSVAVAEEDTCKSDCEETVLEPPPSRLELDSSLIAEEANTTSIEIDASESTSIVNNLGTKNNHDNEMSLSQSSNQDETESSLTAERGESQEEKAGQDQDLKESDKLSSCNLSQHEDSLQSSVEKVESAAESDSSLKEHDVSESPSDKQVLEAASAGHGLDRSEQDTDAPSQTECLQEDSCTEKETSEEDLSQRKQPDVHAHDEISSIDSKPPPTSTSSPLEDQPESLAAAKEPSIPQKDSNQDRDSVDPSVKKTEDDDRSNPTQTTVDLEDDNSSECSKKRDIPRSVQRKSLATLIRRDLSSDDSGTIVSALETLADMAVESPVQRHSIAVTGGLLGVLRVMEDHSTDANIQISGCRALERLARSEYNEVAIAELGGIETVLQAMMGHFDNVAVQEAAWSALWNLTCKNASIKLTLDVPGGMEAIISSMKHHVGEAQVQLNACGAFSNLCAENPERTEDFVKAGGLVAMASALERHWDDASVRSEASATLVALLEPHAEGQELNSCY